MSYAKGQEKKNVEEIEKGYCPICGVIPIIEESGFIYGEKVRFFRCDNCGATFGIFVLSKELRMRIQKINYGELWGNY